ncbi:MAG: hypothetical protein ABIZ09_13045, partial [Rhodoferax sp.]
MLLTNPPRPALIQNFIGPQRIHTALKHDQSPDFNCVSEARTFRLDLTALLTGSISSGQPIKIAP